MNSSSLSPHEFALNRPPWVATTLGSFLIFTIVVDILGNLLVIFSVYRNKKLRNTGRIAFKPNMASRLNIYSFKLLIFKTTHPNDLSASKSSISIIFLISPVTVYSMLELVVVTKIELISHQLFLKFSCTYMSYHSDETIPLLLETNVTFLLYNYMQFIAINSIIHLYRVQISSMYYLFQF